MSLIETIQQLNTRPRNQEEEYEYTSDFLEWFYYNVYKEQGFDKYPILYQVKMETDYETIQNNCKTLINVTNSKNIDNDTLVESYETMKAWLLDTINKYND